MRRLAIAVFRLSRSAPAVSVLAHGSLVASLFWVAGVAGPGAGPVQPSRLSSNPERREPAPEPEEPVATRPRPPETPREQSLEEPPPSEPEIFASDDPPPRVADGIGLPPSERCTGKPIRPRRPPKVKSAGPPGPEPGPEIAPPKRKRKVVPPRPVHQPKPESDRRGVVVLDIEVLTDGSVGEVAVAVSSGISRLDRTAVRAAKRWEFHPATVDGVAVVRWVRIRIVFE